MLLADMLLREWLEALGAKSLERCSLADILYFEFGDTYDIVMHVGQRYQDNDLERMLSVIRDEVTTHNTTVLLKGRGERMGLSITYPFIKGHKVMQVRPVVWTGVIPPPDIDVVVEQIGQAITFYNLTGSFVPGFSKDNL